MIKQTKSAFALLFLVFLFTGGCSTLTSQEVPVQSEPSKAITYDDPFAYCAAAGTIDSPDARYVGPKMPDSILEGMIAKGVVPADAPLEFRRNAVWRCMNGHVWACQFGANIPCLEKADISKVPTSAMEDYCKTNPDGGIPAYVTGRATVYEWKCTSGKPEVGRQVTQVDPQGFLAIFWYDLTPK